MKTISQVARLTGVSTRTLQYYDEIGLLKPTGLSPSGYRLYDDKALEKLQQILFFKELDFRLKDIKELLDNEDFDKIKAFKEQKKLLCLKRKRLDDLIKLLSKLEKGEQCMSFKEFDLSEYINALETFKNQKTDDVITYWGSVEKFNEFIQKIREDEGHLAQIAVKQFGSVEKYTEAMKYNLEHFSELMEKYEKLKENTDEIQNKSKDLYYKLTSDMTKDVSSHDIQEIVHQLIKYTEETNIGIDMGEGYWDLVCDSFSNELVRATIDKDYGAGASEYISRALRYYMSHH